MTSALCQSLGELPLAHPPPLHVRYIFLPTPPLHPPNDVPVNISYGNPYDTPLHSPP